MLLRKLSLSSKTICPQTNAVTNIRKFSRYCIYKAFLMLTTFVIHNLDFSHKSVPNLSSIFSTTKVKSTGKIFLFAALGWWKDGLCYGGAPHPRQGSHPGRNRGSTELDIHRQHNTILERLWTRNQFSDIYGPISNIFSFI